MASILSADPARDVSDTSTDAKPATTLNECFTVAWSIACRDGVTDSAFWAHVRLLAERCRTDDAWQSLLGVLTQISLSDRPPPLDRAGEVSSSRSKPNGAHG